MGYKMRTKSNWNSSNASAQKIKWEKLRSEVPFYGFIISFYALTMRNIGFVCTAFGENK